MKLDRDTIDAITILHDAMTNVVTGGPGQPLFDGRTAASWIYDAVHHLAYPDRALFPKLRHQPKTKRRNGRLGNGRASR